MSGTSVGISSKRLVGEKSGQGKINSVRSPRLSFNSFHIGFFHRLAAGILAFLSASNATAYSEYFNVPDFTETGSATTIEWDCGGPGADGVDGFCLMEGAPVSTGSNYSGRQTSTFTLPQGSHSFRIEYNIITGYDHYGPQWRVETGPWKTVVVKPRPGVPGSLSLPASDNDGGFRYDWGDVSGATYYEWREKLSSWGAPQNRSTSYVDLSGRASGLYSYQVRACNEVGCSSYSSSKDIRVVIPPGTPPSITVPATTDGVFSVSWGTSTGTVTRYELERSSGSWAQIYSGTAKSLAQSGLGLGSYTYRVRACNVISGYTACSGWRTSGAVSVAVPATPSLSASTSGSSDGAYSLSWNTLANTDTYTLEERIGTGSWTSVQNSSASGKSFSGRTDNTYSYRVKACNNAGCGSYSASKVVDVANTPGIPASISVPTSATDGSFTVSWSASTGNVTAYNLDSRLGSGSWGNIQNGTSRSKSLSGLAAGSYTFRVRACNTIGAQTSCSGWRTSPATLVSAPDASPSITLASSDGDGSYSVSWTATANTSKYTLQEMSDGGSWITLQDSAALNKAISGNGNGTYSYRVQSCNALGCAAYSAVQTMDVALKPGIPASITVPEASGKAFNISWEAGSGSITAYKLQRLAGSSETTIYSQLTPRSHGEVAPASGMYTYRVKACRTSGSFENCSDWRTSNTVTIVDKPSMPLQGFSANPGTGGGVALDWSGVAAQIPEPVSYFILEYQIDGGAWVAPYSYKGTGTGFQLSSIGEGEHQFSLRACVSVPTSGQPFELCSDRNLEPPPVARPSGAPTWNSGLATTSSSGSHHLGWSHIANSSWYVLQQKNGGNWINLDTTSNQFYSFNNQPSGRYTYRVQACNGFGCGTQNSTEFTVDVARQPDTPVFGNIPSLSDGNHSVGWSNVLDDVTHYALEHSLNGGTNWNPVLSTNTLSKSFAALEEGTYLYRIRACNTVGSFTNCSGWRTSTSVSVAAPASSPTFNSAGGTNITGQYDLNWSSVDNTTSYTLEEQVGSGSWTSVQNSGSRSKTYSGKTDNTYNYRVKACNAIGCSANSTTLTFVVAITPPMPTVIDAPTKAYGSVNVSWNATTGTAIYHELAKRSEGGSWSSPIYSGTGANHTDTISQNGNLQYRVRSCRSSTAGNLCSGWRLSGYIDANATTQSGDVITKPAPIGGDPLATVADPANSPLTGEVYNGSLEGGYSVGDDGSFNYSLPIEVSPGIQGVQPRLSLSYNSSRRNGLLGWGWSLDGLSSISRCRATFIQDGYSSGVMHDDNYRFCLNGSRLVEVAPDEYRTEAESFLRIFNRGTYWEVIARDGGIRRYGFSANSRALDGNGSVLSWHLDKTSDSWGNHYTVNYQSGDTYHRPASISYTGTNIHNANKSIVFEYENRADIIAGYHAGKKNVEDKRLARVDIQVNGQTAWSYHLRYQQYGSSYHGKQYSDPVRISRLASIERCFASDTICQQPIEFDWSERSQNQHVYSAIENADPGLASPDPFVDIDNDGIADEIEHLSTTTVDIEFERIENGIAEPDTFTAETTQQALDLNGDGYREIIQNNAYTAEGMQVYPNQAAGSERAIGTVPMAGYHVPANQLSFVGARFYLAVPYHYQGGSTSETWIEKDRKFAYSIQYADIDGDGLLDLVRGMPSCYITHLYCEFLDPNNIPLNKTSLGNNQVGYSREISVAYNTGTGWEKENGQIKFHTLYSDRDNQKLEAQPQFMDVNGDGMMDVYLAASSVDGSWPSTLLLNSGGSRSEITLTESETFSGQRYIGDFNGDGIKDFAYLPIQYSDQAANLGFLEVSLGTGNGFEPFTTATADAEFSIFCNADKFKRSKCSHSVIDFNGDGYDDLIEYGGCLPTGECFDELAQNGRAPFIAQVWLSKGINANGAVTFAPPIEYRNRTILENEIGTSAPESQAFDGRTRPYFYDYNNDGLLEDDLRLSHSLVQHRLERVLSQQAEIRVDYRSFAGTDVYLSTEESDLAGATTSEVGDEFISQPQKTAKRFGVREIKVSTATDEANPPFNTTTYQYTGARIHTAGYGNLGFARREVIAQSADSTETLRTVTDYHQLATANYKLAGVVKRQRIYTATNEHGQQLIGDTRNQWKLRLYADDIDAGGYNSPHYFPYLYESSSRTWALDGTELTTQLTRNHPVASHACGQLDTNAIDDVITAVAGSGDDMDYHTDGVLLFSATASCDAAYPTAPGVTPPSRDNAVRINTLTNTGVQTRGNAIGLVTSTTVGAGTGIDLAAASVLREREAQVTYTASGAVHTRTTEPGGENQLTTTYGYETWGALKSIQETWANRADDGLPGTGRTTTIANLISGDGSVTVTTTQPLLGAATVVYDPVFGQPIEQTDINGLTTHTQYDDLGRVSRVDYADGTSTQIDYRTCNDCFGYNDNDHWYLQSKTSGGMDTRTFYDRQNRPVGERGWSLGGATYSVQTYNAQGKVATVSLPFYATDIPQTTHHQYDLLGRLQSTTLPDGSVQSVQYNGFITQSTNAENQTQQRIANGAGWVMQSIDNAGTPVDFAYGPFGELETTRVNNDASTQVDILYDNAGRKIQLNDPNAGTIDYTYNALGLVASETNANNQTTAYTYDVLGRQRTRTDADTYTHQWTYDQNGHKGQLTRLAGYTTEGHAYTETYTYTPYGQPATVAAAFEGKNFSVNHSYDNYGRPLATTYPTGYRVANIHNAQGFVTQVVNTADKRPLWIAEQANASGQITRYTLGDGSVTERAYTDETGLIESIATTRGSATLMNQSYTFDHIGNLTERSDNLYGVVQSFCHDEMNRLTAARFDGCAASDADYTYDPLGNITSKTEVGSYTYDQTGNAGPHAVTAANDLTFEYDAAGNLLRARNSTNQIVREVTWSAINKPTRISNNSHWSEIHYGPDESRIKREDSTGRATYYFGSLYEETTYGMESHRVHAIGDFALYIEDAYTGQGHHEFLHRDHLGSVVARTTDKDTGDNEWLAYGAWGNRLLVAWDGIEEAPGYQAPSVRGYTGHEHLDPIGLIDMGGRVFDPELGRFLSPDPFIQAPYNTQSYNRYSYVFNNPLSYTDPTGYFCSGYDSNGCGGANFYFDAGFYFGEDQKPLEEVVVTGQQQRQEEAFRQSSIDIMRQYSSQQQDYVNFAADQIYQAALANGGSTIIYENGQLYQINVNGKKAGNAQNEWIGFKNNTDGDVILCIGPSACASNSNIGNASNVDSALAVSELVPTSKFIGKLGKGIWTATKRLSGVGNAFRHWKNHGSEFPGLKNALQYYRASKNFLHNPPAGTLTRVRSNGDIVRYHPGTNTFGVMTKDGVPRTMFKPDPSKHGYSTNLEYFNNQ